MLKPHQRLTFEYDEPQRRAIFRLAEVHHAIIVPNEDMSKESKTPEGHWRLTVEASELEL